MIFKSTRATIASKSEMADKSKAVYASMIMRLATNTLTIYHTASPVSFRLSPLATRFAVAFFHSWAKTNSLEGSIVLMHPHDYVDCSFDSGPAPIQFPHRSIC